MMLPDLSLKQLTHSFMSTRYMNTVSFPYVFLLGLYWNTAKQGEEKL